MKTGTTARILVISERYRPENFLINDFVDSLHGQGFSVTVLTQVPSYPADRLFEAYPNRHSTILESGIRVRRFPTVLGYKRSVVRKIFGYLLFMFRVCWFSLRELPRHDSVFVYHTGPLTQALPLVLAKYLFRKRTLIWTQDVWPDTVFAYGLPDSGVLAVLLKSFVRLVYHACDCVCVSSAGFVQRVQPYVGRNCMVRFIPQWVPEAFLAAAPAPYILNSQACTFIFTGNIGTMQNLENVIMAFSNFTTVEAVLYILGDGSQRAALEQLVKELDCSNVYFLDTVPVGQVFGCIQQCDFSLLSLRNDPILNLTVPAKFQAYLAAGKPLLAVCSGEVQDLVQHENLGLSALPDDPRDISRAIKECICLPPAKYDTCRTNMKRLLAERYDKISIVQQFSALLSDGE